MMFKKIAVLLVVAVLLAKGVNLAFADTQTCQSMLCNSTGQAKATTPALSGIPKDMSVADMFQKLKLSHEQYASLYEIINKQMPIVQENTHNLAQAKNLLEDMALHKQYDEMIADKLTQTIAESTANLAVLQAAREYELLAMLTPEQVKIYQDIAVKPIQ
jgi:Spy/CpxP family protein refolding chaperone